MGKLFVLSLAIIYSIIISAIASLPVLFWGLSLIRYFTTFCLVLAAQFFLGRLWNYFVDQREFTKRQKIQATESLANAVQHAQMPCEYCGTTNMVKVLIGEENNTYDCGACGQKNAVIIELSGARVTEPIMPKAEVAEIFKNLDK